MKKEDQAKDKHNTLTHKERYVDDDVAKQRGDRIVTYIYLICCSETVCRVRL